MVEQLDSYAHAQSCRSTLCSETKATSRPC